MPAILSGFARNLSTSSDTLFLLVCSLTPSKWTVYLPRGVLEEDFMRIRILGSLVATWSLLSACSSTEWVHPNKPSGEFATDYNRCESMVLRDPKLQQGNQLMILNATERCVQKEGWRLIEQP